MPLTTEGKKLLHRFQEEYGKDKGESVFYAFMNKEPIRALRLEHYKIKKHR